MNRKPVLVGFNHDLNRFRAMRRQPVPDEDESSFVLIFIFHIFQHAEDRLRIDATMFYPGQIASLLRP